MHKRQSPASRDGMLETVFFVYGFQEEWLQCHRIDQERSIRDDKKKLEQAKKRLPIWMSSSPGCTRTTFLEISVRTDIKNGCGL